MTGRKSQPGKSPLDLFVIKKELIILSSDEEDELNTDYKPQDMEQGYVIVKEENQQENSKIAVNENMTSRSHLEFIRHPSASVETTSLGSVSLPEVRIQSQITALSKVTIDSGVFSPLQSESITHACQRHEQKTPDGSRAGFLIGDGAGFGKGRIAAGIILVNYLQNRKKAIWLSVSSDLQYDAERDLRDVGLADKHDKITIFNLKKMTRDTSGFNDSTINIVFSTYTTLTEEFHFAEETSTWLKLLLQWCGDNFDGVIVFDECHQTNRLGKNIVHAILELQKKLPNARVVYMSATGVSELRNMAFMSRLGLWGKDTSFKEFKNFLHTFKKGGIGSSEMLAMEMKQRGMYIAWQLTFENVKFKMVQVSSLDSFKFVSVYDNSVKLWLDLIQSFAEAEKLSSADTETYKKMWDYFWLAHFQFFKYLCISAKVMDAVKIANRSLKGGKSVVIGVQATGEAHTLEQKTKMKIKGDELSNFVSTGKSILLSLVEKHFPFLGCYDSSTSNAAGRKRKSVLQTMRESKRMMIDPENEYPLFDCISDMDIEDSEDSNNEESENEREERLKQISSMKDRLLIKIEKFSAMLPQNNVLDQLIDELGGPEKVAEISNREGRVVQKYDGQIEYQSRSNEGIPSEFVNIREIELFMSGEKNIAIVSEIASNGISLHADRRVTNNRIRVYISLELPSSVDIAIQQFGRTCRCNQVSAPEYFLLYSDLVGEERFASMVAKRLKSLGAVDLDNHRSFEKDNKNEISLDTEYGRMALDSTVQAVMGCTNSSTVSTVPPPTDYQGEFFSDVKKALAGVGLISTDDKNTDVFKEKTSVSEFLKRILGVPVELQKKLYRYFTDTMAAVITKAKKTQEFDGLDVLDWGTGQKVCRTKLYTFATKYPTGPNSTAKIELHSFEFDQGMSWNIVRDKWTSLTGENEGFYLSKKTTRNGKYGISCVVQNNETGCGRGVSYTIIRPNTGMHGSVQLAQKFWAALKLKSQKITPDSPQWNGIEEIWNNHYTASKTVCSHTYWNGHCTKRENGLDCQHDVRQKTLHLLCGPILFVWKEIASINKELMQIARVQFEDILVVGLVIPGNCFAKIVELLDRIMKPV